MNTTDSDSAANKLGPTPAELVIMQRWLGKVALVTGAATGIGKATTERLLQCGMKVVACGRRADVLEKLKSDIGAMGELTTVTCDVSKEEDVHAMFSQIKQLYGGLDVCINNAGLGINAPILSGKSEDWQTMLDVNVIGLLRVTREAVAAMKAKGSTEGHIININSMAGHRVLNHPRGHVYTASKFAVTAITTGTRHELLLEQPDLKCRVSVKAIHNMRSCLPAKPPVYKSGQILRFPHFVDAESRLIYAHGPPIGGVALVTGEDGFKLTSYVATPSSFCVTLAL